MNKTIEVIVSPTGETKAETKGFVGAKCRNASKFLEEALGVSHSEQLTAEFHQTASIDQATSQRQQA